MSQEKIESFARLRQAFHALIELDASAQRGELERQRQIDPEFAEQLTQLLAASAVEDLQPTVPVLRFGPYQLGAEIGRGGMGVVYRAQRVDGAFEQEVAIKRLSVHSAGRISRERFLRERQILARLQHANIARLLDGGVASDGSFWLAMELIDGAPITHACDRAKMSITERIQLLLQLIDAVQYAHNQLVVHRDIKPANVLVSDKRELKLLDFGIAKLLESADGDLASEQSVYALTPAYAAPEQLERGIISTQTDVYALGLLLFELVGGVKRSAQPERVKSPLSLAQSWRTLAVGELDHIAAARAIDVRNLTVLAHSDLARIIAKATANEVSQRYSTAIALAEDLRRYLQHRPILARAPTLSYQLGRFLRRNPLSTLLVAATAAALLMSSIWNYRLAQSERAQRLQADEARSLARAEAAAAQAAAATARRESGAHELLREHLLWVLGTQADSQGVFATSSFLDALTDVQANPHMQKIDNRRALSLALARMFSRRTDAQRCLKVLEQEPGLFAQASLSEQAERDTLRAQALAALGQTQAALAASAGASKLTEERPDSNSAEASLLILKGAMLLNSGDPEGAIAALERAQALSAELQGDSLSRGALLSNLAIAYLKAGRLDEALAAQAQTERIWQQAGIGQNSQRSASQNAKGFVLLAQGLAHAAVAHYAQMETTLAIESPAQRAARVGAQARALVQLGRFDQAKRANEGVAEQMCENVGAKTPLCARMWVAHAEVALNLGDLAGAENAIRQAEASAAGLSDPGLPLLLNLTEALIQAQNKRGQAAITLAQQRLREVAAAGDRGYRSVEYALQFAYRLKAAGRAKDAAEIAELALKLSAGLSYPAGSVHQAQLRLWRAYLTDPNGVEAKAALAAYRQLLGADNPWLVAWK